MTEILDRIEKEEIRDLLGKGWLTHDFMWFYSTCQQLGMETANTLNKAAIKSLAPIEVQRAKKVLGLNKEKINTFDELMDFMLGALELILPHSVFKHSHFSAPSKNLLHWEWANGECFAYKGMKQIGLIDEYRCGVMYRIECWIEALGISYNIDPKINKCIMYERGECSGDIEVFFDE